MHTRTLHGIYLTNNLFSIFLLKKKSNSSYVIQAPFSTLRVYLGHLYLETEDSWLFVNFVLQKGV